MTTHNFPGDRPNSSVVDKDYDECSSTFEVRSLHEYIPLPLDSFLKIDTRDLYR